MLSGHYFACLFLEKAFVGTRRWVLPTRLPCHVGPGFLPMSSFSWGSVYRGESEVSGSPPWRAGDVDLFCFKLGELIV